MPALGFRSRPWLRRALALAPLLAVVATGAFQWPIALAASGTVYVDGHASTCSDTASGAGSASQPFCTIGAAAAAATSGMTVSVNTGTYFENVNVAHSGVQGAPITFTPSPGSSVTITGQLHGFTVAGQSWVTISGFTITGTSGFGILLSGSAHVTVSGNHVSYSGQPVSGQTAQGIYLTSTTSSLIANNTVDHNTAAGIGLYSSSTSDEVRHNLVFNNAEQWERNAQGIDVQSASATIDYNIAHDNEDSGIQFYPGGNNGVVFGNITYNNGDHGIDNFSVTGGVLTGNTVYHNCTSGINIEGTSANFVVENNIAVDNAVYPAYNGIACNRRTGNIGVYDSAPSSTRADYNLVNLTAAGALYVWNSTSYSTLSALQSATGQESHGLQADPKWTNAGAGDFHLAGGSPAIDSADSGAAAEPAVDVDGNARVDDPATPNTGAGTRPFDDRGAYEFQPPATAATCQTSGPSGGTYTVTVCIVSPESGWVLSGAAPISFTVTFNGANPGLNQPVLFLDGQYFTQSFTTAPPFDKFSLPTTKYVDGTHVLSLEADVLDGFKSQWASVTLDFSNGIETPPINTGSFVPVSGAMPASGQYVIGAVGDGANGTAAADGVATEVYNWNPGLFLYLGDVYLNASVGDFYNLYGTNGAHYGMLRAITNPTIGNHEYQSGTPAPYFDYWNNVPHYYSFNVAGWHFISLDSTFEFNQYSVGSPQYTWLVNDLKANTSPCTVVYYHRPVFGASWTGGAPELMPIWSLLAQYHVKLVLNGHEHDYQRWVPLDGSGNANPNGVTEIVAGMGGNGIDSIVSTDPRIAFSDGTGGDYGALRLTLTSTGLKYEFILTTGAMPDSGTIACSVNDTQAPTVPVGLTATAPAQNQVKLTWTASTDNVGVAGYTVYRNGVSAGTTTTPSFTDGSVVASTAYSYTVDAFDAAGNHSAQSAAVTVTTPAPDTQPPSIPTGLAATGTSASTVNLTWAASTDNVGVTGYTVYRNGIAVATSTTTSYADTGLAAATTYTYTVDAFDAAGNRSAQSASASATTGSKPITYVQSATQATGGRYITTTVSLKGPVAAGDLLTGWFGQWDAAGQVQVSDNVNGAWTRVSGIPYSTGKGDIALFYVANAKASSSLTITITASAATYLTGTVAEYSGAAVASPLDKYAMKAGSGTSVDSGSTAVVPAGELVFAALTANNNPGNITPGTSQGATFTLRSNYGDSADADIVSGNAGAQDGRFTITTSGSWYAVAAVFKPGVTDTSPPSVPAGVAAADGAGSVKVSWSASTDNIGVAGYTVYRNGSVLTTVSGTTLSFVDSGVASVTSYTYTVDAFDAAGNHSAQSSPATVTTLDWVPPSAPGGLTGSASSMTQVNLSWSASTDNVGVTGYTVYRNGSQLAVLDASATTYSDGTANAATTYSYAVDAFDAAGNHSSKSTVNVTTPSPPDTTPPSVPSGLTANPTSPVQIALGWTASTDNVAVAGYDVYRDGSLVATVGASTLAYNDAVSAGSTHSYTVDAFDAAGNHSPTSGPVTVTTPTADTTPPTTPAGLTATAAGSALVNLSWSAATDNVGVAGYDVYRNGAILSTLPAGTLSLADTTVTSGTNYTYAVDAFDAAGNYSPASAGVTVHVPGQVKFVQAKVVTTSRVTSVTLTFGAVAAGDLLVGWFAQYDSTGQVQVSDNVNGAWTRSVSTTWKTTTSGDIALFYVANAAAAPSGLTVTVSAAVATYLQVAAAEYSGVAASNPLDQAVVGKGSSTAADSGLTAAVGAGDLVFGAMVATNGPGTLTPGTSQGVTFVARAQSGSGTQAEEDVLSSAAGQQHAGYTFGTSVPWFMVCAAFKPA